jgi:hypothetical protein
MAARKILRPRATGARFSISPIRTESSTGCARYPDGHYESGADIADDEWITYKLDIDEARVRVSVNGQEELVLTDPKAAPAAGDVGLWVGIGTEGYFTNLRVTPR